MGDIIDFQRPTQNTISSSKEGGWGLSTLADRNFYVVVEDNQTHLKKGVYISHNFPLFFLTTKDFQGICKQAIEEVWHTWYKNQKVDYDRLVVISVISIH